MSMKTCNNRIERRKKLQSFIEGLSLALFDFELLTGIKKNKKNKNELKFLDKISQFYGREGNISLKTLQTNKLYNKKNKKTESWIEVREMICTGKLKIEDVNIFEFLDVYSEEILEDMEEFGFVRFKKGKPVFTEKTERIIAEIALKLALKELNSKAIGDFKSNRIGFLTPSSRLIEFDEWMHNFDMLDIQESLINEFLNSGRIDIGNNLLAREFKSRDKVIFVVLLDISDSMRGEKLKGAVRASLALRLVAEKLNRNLKIYAFNHEVRRIRDGDLVNLTARGRTNIASALMKVVKLAEREDATPVVFLVTDGEPTSPENPISKALSAAERLGKFREARLTLIMLNNDTRYDEFCLALIKKVRKSSFIKLNPGDLSVYFIKEFFNSD